MPRSATRPRSRRKQRIVVGVNHYEIPVEDDEPIPILRIDPELEREQVERVQAAPRHAATRERSRPRSPQLKQAAAGEPTNLMEPIVAAAKAYVTMGEMCDAFRDVWGIWRETPVF